MSRFSNAMSDAIINAELRRPWPGQRPSAYEQQAQQVELLASLSVREQATLGMLMVVGEKLERHGDKLVLHLEPDLRVTYNPSELLSPVYVLQGPRATRPSRHLHVFLKGFLELAVEQQRSVLIRELTRVRISREYKEVLQEPPLSAHIHKGDKS
jgi:hypothetical protein